MFLLKPKKNDIEQLIKSHFNIEAPEYWSRIETTDNVVLQPLTENKKKRFPIYRIVAAAACLALIVTVSAFGAPHLFGESDESIIVYGQDTPVRIGQMGSIKASFEKPYTFEEAYEEADLVVEIVITEWLGELDQEGLGQTTYFKASILNEYKNSLNFQENEIVLLQAGNSKWTYKGYPLFKNGDRFLLSLLWVDPVNYSEFCIDGEDCFAIVGSQLTEMQIMEKNNKKFALKRNLYQNFTDIENLMESNSTGIIEDAFMQDEVLSQAGTKFECVYSLDNLENYMDNLKEGDENE